VSFANDVSESEVPLAGFQGETLNDLGGGLGGGLLVTQYSSSEERIGLAQTYRPWCAEVGYIRSSPQREYSPRNIPSETSPTRRGFTPVPAKGTSLSLVSLRYYSLRSSIPWIPVLAMLAVVIR